jgi:type II secretory pathway component PulF
MVQAGARSNDLPGMLTLLADYYQRANSLWTRLKGLMVYPVIVLFTSFGLSLFLAVIFNSLAGSSKDWGGQEAPGQDSLNVGLYLPAIFLGFVACVALAAVTLPALRRFLRWRLPGFKESSLSLAASTIKLMLQGGQSLTQAIGIMQQVEAATPAGEDLQRWQRRLAEGRGKFSEFAGENKTFPPLFIWLVAQGGEDVVTGFGRAAEVYYARAMHRMDLLLYAALPVSVLLLGLMIVGQVLPAVRVLTSMLGSLGDLDAGTGGN